jgi:hypothetical protein
VKYALIGGFALHLLGFERPTFDIDLLVDPAAENVERLRRALSVLEDQAVRDVADDDLAKYGVVRVADEIVVDLLGKACGVALVDVENGIETVVVDGVPIKTLSPKALLRTKETARPKDALDREFLEQLVGGAGADEA